MLRTSRSVVVTALTAGLALALTSGPAFAWWKTTGTGSGSATTTTLSAGSMTSVTADATTSLQMNLVWASSTVTGISPTVSADGYEVRRYTSAAGAGGTYVCGTSAATFLAAASCSDVAPSTSTVWYAVTPHYKHWSGTESALMPGTPTAAGFVLTAPASAVAGTAFDVTVQAKRLDGTTNDTTYTGSHTLQITGSASPNSTVPSITTATLTFSSSGAATANIKLYKAEANSSFTLSDVSTPSRAGSAQSTVSHAAVQLSIVGCPTSQKKSTATAGCALHRPAVDAYGNATTETVSVGITATNVASGSSPQTLTLIGAADTSFSVTMNTSSGGSTVISTSTVPTGYTAAATVAINHTN